MRRTRLAAFLALVALVLAAFPAAAFGLTSARVYGTAVTYTTPATVTGKLQYLSGSSWLARSGATAKLYKYDAATATWVYVKSATTSSTGAFSFSIAHNGQWKVTSVATTKYAACSSAAFTGTEAAPSRIETFAGTPVLTSASPTQALKYSWTLPAGGGAPENYLVLINGKSYTALPAGTTSFTVTPATSNGLIVAGYNYIQVVPQNCTASTKSYPILFRYGTYTDTVTTDFAYAQAYLMQMQDTYIYLDGVTLSFGTTPSGYQAVSYYSSGRILISTTHTAKVQTILAHEIWHIIDYRDNGVIDWGEAIAPKNAADYKKPGVL